MPFLEWICFTKTTAISTPMDAVSALTSIRAGFEAGPAAHPTQPTWVVQELSAVAGVASGEPIPGVKDGASPILLL